MAVWRRIACWISKATCAQANASACVPTPTSAHARTHSQKQAQKYDGEIAFFTATIVLLTRLNVSDTFPLFFLYG